MDDRELDDLFQGARAAAPAPSEALVARILADAAALQPRHALAAPARRAGLISRLAEAFGGRGVLAGLAGTAAAGLALGFYSPALTASWPASLLSGAADTVELFPDAETFFSAVEGQG